MIPENVIESVREATNLAVLAREYGVKLTRSADGFTALCPFHNEKSPSFRIHAKGPRAGQFKCFGCGEAGSVLDFVMKIESWPFLSALKYLAERSGITVTSQTVTTAQRAASAEDRLIAAWWWEQRTVQMRAVLERAIEEHTQPDDDFCECVGRCIRRVEEMNQETRFLLFKSQVSREDREQWAVDVEEERRFTAAWMRLSTEEDRNVSEYRRV